MDGSGGPPVLAGRREAPSPRRGRQGLAGDVPQRWLTVKVIALHTAPSAVAARLKGGPQDGAALRRSCEAVHGRHPCRRPPGAPGFALPPHRLTASMPIDARCVHAVPLTSVEPRVNGAPRRAWCGTWGSSGRRAMPPDGLSSMEQAAREPRKGGLEVLHHKGRGIHSATGTPGRVCSSSGPGGLVAQSAKSVGLAFGARCAPVWPADPVGSAASMRQAGGPCKPEKCHYHADTRHRTVATWR